MKIYEMVIFNQVLLNEGNVYNIIFGKFIVLVDGVYFFSWIIFLDVGKYFIIEIVFNNIVIVYNCIDGRGCLNNLGFVMLFFNVNIKMKKGDKVWIRIYYNYG